jgi:Predicted metal binding domain/Protein of Unknown function (DUF2604)
MAGPHKITITVVVSGARVDVTANVHQKVAHLIHEALKEAGIPHPKVEDWTLRFADGGGAIDPDLKIEKAGITDGATLFLDPDEGGGGEAAVTFNPAQTEPPPPPLLVDPAVSAAKLERQLADWAANSEVYRTRGWYLLGHEDLEVDIAFTARLPIAPGNDLVVIPLAIKLGFHNYDVWPPSLRVIDPISRRWLELPRVRAIDFDATDDAGAPLDLFINHHPDTGHVFLCKPGTREYHTHFEHSGDDWLLYRDQGFGTIGRLSDLLWRTAVCTIAGLNFGAQRPPFGEAIEGIVPGLGIEIRQEKPQDPAPQQMGQPIPIQQLPQEMLAQLPPQIQALVSDQQ